MVRVRLEGTDFITEHQTYAIGLKADQQTGYYTPYWTQLSTPSTGKYTPVFNLDNVESRKNNDIGEIRGLLLARGDHVGRYTEIENASAKSYKNGIGRSAVMNSQAELDKLTHTIMTKVNDLLSPTKSLNDYITESGEGTKTVTGVTAGGNNIASVDADGNVTISSDAYSSLTYTAEGGVTKNLSSDSLIFDDINPGVGASGKIPSEEIFSRVQGDRYDKITLDTPLTITYSDGSTKTVTEAYLYRPETTDDRYSLYTLNNVEVNQTLVDSPEELPSKRLNTNQDNVIYDIGSQIDALWENIDYQINPADDTKCSIMDFYTKYVGELANSGSVYTTTAESLDGTSKSIESSRQGVIGVSSDDELTNMIKYQNAYNAPSRYINVVSTMIDYLLNSLT